MADLIINHDLCLACSSSLPATAAKIISEKVFTTQCCHKSICAKCISQNPRLARYNPCLACLGGVGVIAAGAGKGKVEAANIDGAVRDEDTFILGDDEDEQEEAPPAYPADPAETSSVDGSTTRLMEPSETIMDAPESSTSGGPARYYIKRSDTLQGIALRFGVNGRELCTLNNLPPSTLSITPHILHTRDSILLPPSAKIASTDLNKPSPDEQRRREARRAEKRLQVVAKEADWRVARAYVALADEEESGDLKKSRMQGIEGRALDQYLQDSEWEGRVGKPCIQGFPYFAQPPSPTKGMAGGSAWTFKLW